MTDEEDKQLRRLPVPLAVFRVILGAVKVSTPVLLWMARRRRAALPNTLEMVAVTGTYGKSTTVLMLRSVLGLGAALKNTRNTLAFTALAVLLCSRKNRFEVLEAAVSRPGHMESIAPVIQPTTAVVTCIGSEHHTSMGSTDVTRHEKAFLVRSLPPEGNAVLNGDDPNVLWMADQTRAAVRTFGFGEENNTRILSHTIDWPRGTRVVLGLRGEELTFETRLVGRPGLYALAATVTVADICGVPMDEVRRRVSAVQPTPGRLEPVRLKDGVYFLRDDFKSPRETIFEAIDTMDAIPVADKLFVIGEETEADMSTHDLYRRIGQRIAETEGRVVYLGPSRKHRDLKRGFIAAGGAADSLGCAASIREAVQMVKDRLGMEQVILLKGRNVQKMGRIAMALKEDALHCDLDYCELKLECRACPRWQGSGPS